MIFLLATTDLANDRRMQRICQSLHQAGYKPCLVGRLLHDSPTLAGLDFDTLRLKCKFHRSFMFYIEFNIRLFFLLIKKRKQYKLVCAADLDTLLAGYLASKLLGKKLVYDAHEWFCQTPELQNRPFAKQIWQLLEQSLLPQIKYAYTVSDSIAAVFERKYGLKAQTIRNMAPLSEVCEVLADNTQKPAYFVYIGAVNQGRGIEQIIEAMADIPADLIICGKGDLLVEMKQLAAKLGLSTKIRFMGQVPPSDLHLICSHAIAGFLLLEPSSKSYYFSLANKFFDYAAAGIPQILSRLPEYEKHCIDYQVGVFCSLEPKDIAAALRVLLEQPEYYASLSANARAARLEWNWEKESEKLLDFYKNILKI